MDSHSVRVFRAAVHRDASLWWRSNRARLDGRPKFERFASSNGGKVGLVKPERPHHIRRHHRIDNVCDVVAVSWDIDRPCRSGGSWPVGPWWSGHDDVMRQVDYICWLWMVRCGVNRINVLLTSATCVVRVRIGQFGEKFCHFGKLYKAIFRNGRA